MIALCFALVALSLMLGGALIAAIRWEHNAVAERDFALTLLDDERKVAEEYKSQRDVEVAAHQVTKTQLAQEKALRSVAEKARDDAQERVRNALAKHIKDATDEEIHALTVEMFAPSLSVVPASVKASSRPSADDLIDPSSDV